MVDARRAWAGAGGPVELLVVLFAAFKVIQIAVFVGWHLALGDGTLLPYSRDPGVVAAGALLIAVGQALNLSVFTRLGKIGVFYGNKFGHTVSWCRKFPFTWFDHPQYVGTVIAIWGFFFLMRFPAQTGSCSRCSKVSITPWARTSSAIRFKATR